jgi:hypothetical protein
MNRGRFCERFFPMSFFHPRAIQPRNSFPEQVFNPAVSSYENCKRPRRNHRSKRENCFAIFILVCNFHISLQFSYQFAILTFWCMVPTWMFAIFIWVCNFHMSLQFSYQFAILTRLEDFLRTRIHTDSHVTMNLNS